MARIITSETDVPHGWVRIADAATSATDGKILSDAHNSGALPAVKLVRTTSSYRTAPVWVDPVAAKALLSRCQDKRDGVTKPAIVQPGGDDVAVQLCRIADVLERIAGRFGA